MRTFPFSSAPQSMRFAINYGTTARSWTRLSAEAVTAA